MLRTRWAAIGAAIAVSVGAGGLGIARAALDSGDKPVTVTVEATRIVDTRNDIGVDGTLGDASPQVVQVTGTVPVAPSGTRAVVPDDAIGVLVNVTVVAPTSSGFLSLRAGDATGSPSTSTVNFLAGVNTPNAATVDLSSDGRIQIWVDTVDPGGTAHVLLDVVGYTVDHRHDDRYYTEAQVDELLDQKANASSVFSTADYAASQAVASAFVQFDGIKELSVGTQQTILEMPVDIPSGGGFLLVDGLAKGVVDSGVAVSCWASVDSTSPPSNRTGFQYTGGLAVTSVSVKEGFEVSGGAHVVYLVCEQTNGTGNQADIQLGRLSALFTKYSILAAD